MIEEIREHNGMKADEIYLEWNVALNQKINGAEWIYISWKKKSQENNNVSENQKFYILKVETIELFIAETCIESYWIRLHLRIFIVFKELKLYILEHLINQFTTFQYLFR